MGKNGFRPFCKELLSQSYVTYSLITALYSHPIIYHPIIICLYYNIASMVETLFS